MIRFTEGLPGHGMTHVKKQAFQPAAVLTASGDMVKLRRPVDAHEFAGNSQAKELPEEFCAAGGLSVKQAVARLSEFVAVRAHHSAASRPVSNTGLNPQGNEKQAFALGIDYATFVFQSSMAVEMGQTTETIVAWLFGSTSMTTSKLELKTWQFYKVSCFIHGPDGKVVGRIGVGGNGDTWCVSLSGAGCALVKNWHHTVIQARLLQAHLSRVDVAFDDFDGLIFGSIHDVNQLAKSGAFNARTGKPAATRFFDDHGKGGGCTVYVGKRGRKQLCVYEKGKQLKAEESPWIRCELRLWAADSVIPLEVLERPHEFLRGSYELLSRRLPLAKAAQWNLRLDMRGHCIQRGGVDAELVVERRAHRPGADHVHPHTARQQFSGKRACQAH